MDQSSPPAHGPHLPTAAAMQALLDEVRAEYPSIPERVFELILAQRLEALGYEARFWVTERPRIYPTGPE